MTEVRYITRIVDAGTGTQSHTFPVMRGEKEIVSAVVRPMTYNYAHKITFSVFQETGGQPDLEIHTEEAFGQSWTLGRPLRVSGSVHGFYVGLFCECPESEKVTFTIGVRDVYD